MDLIAKLQRLATSLCCPAGLLRSRAEVEAAALAKERVAETQWIDGTTLHEAWSEGFADGWDAHERHAALQAHLRGHR